MKKIRSVMLPIAISLLLAGCSHNTNNNDKSNENSGETTTSNTAQATPNDINGSNHTRTEQTGGNNKPVAMQQSITMSEDNSSEIELKATAKDDQSLAYIISQNPLHGKLSGTTPYIIYTPNKDYNGKDEFSFVASDGLSDSDIATISITITPVNDKPRAVKDSAKTNEDTAITLDVLSNDSDVDTHDKLEIVSIATPAYGTATIQDGKIRYVPAMNYYGTLSFTYMISDGHGGNGQADVSLTVLSVNDTPIPQKQSLLLAEDTSFTFELNATDPEDDPINYHISKDPSHGILTGTIPNLTYTPTKDFNGKDEFVFIASDGTDYDNAHIKIEVTPVNDAPVAANDIATTKEDTPIFINILGNDTDIDINDTLHLDSLSTPLHGTVTIKEDKVYYEPSQDFSGDDVFTYTISDRNGENSEARVSISITPVNDAPIAKISGGTKIALKQTTTLSGVLSTDVDGDSLVYEWSLDGNVVSNEAFFIYTGNQLGSFEFELKVTDPQGLSHKTISAVEVTRPNNKTTDKYNDIFAKKPPAITPLEDTAIDNDLGDIQSKSDDLIKEAEAIIAKHGLTLDTKALTKEEQEAISHRKTRIEQEVKNHEN